MIFLSIWITKSQLLINNDMSDIININIGQAGIRIGEKFL